MHHDHSHRFHDHAAHEQRSLALNTKPVSAVLLGAGHRIAIAGFLSALLWAGVLLAMR